MSKRGSLIALLVILAGLATVAWFWLLPSPPDRQPVPAEGPSPGQSKGAPEPSSEGGVSQLPAGSNPDLARFKRRESEPAAASADFRVRGFVTNIQGAALIGAKVSLGAACEGESALASASTDTIGFYQVRFPDSGDDMRKACLRVERAGYSPVFEWIQPDTGWQKKDFSLTPASATFGRRITDPLGDGSRGAFPDFELLPLHRHKPTVVGRGPATGLPVRGRSFLRAVGSPADFEPKTIFPKRYRY